jgi:hypothetical protein
MSGTYSNAPCTEEGYQKNSITLAILVDFFVIVLFHETKIPMVDMEVQMYSNFSKKIQKNEISKLHEEWKISYSIEVSKNGGVVHAFFQNARSIPKLPYNSKN